MYPAGRQSVRELEAVHSDSQTANRFRLHLRLTDVVFCDSLGTCAFECPDLWKVAGLATAVYTAT